MTREEILGMEAGLELDSLIAEKVMGYKKEFNKRTVIRGTEHFYRLWVSGNEIISPIALYQPSRDIKAAWEVVEKLVTSNKRVMIYNLIQGFKVKIFLSTGEVIVNINAKTAPEAICKAALLVVLEEKAEA